jgi:membrane protein required for colicin V production
MWLDVIALVLLAGFALVGVFRGALSSGLRLLGLVAAYGISLALAPVVADAASLAPPFGVAIAGAGLFVVAYFVLGALAFVVVALDRRRRAGMGRGALDRTLGGVFGLARGGVMALMVAWLGLWVDALRVAGPLAELPPIGPSISAEATRSVVSAGLETTLGHDTPGARMAVRFAADPAESVTALQEVIDNPRVVGLRDDDLFWTYVQHGSYDAALNRASFVGIAYDETLRRTFFELGLVDAEQAADARLFRNALREVLLEIGPRVKTLREDPEVQELLRDPDIVRALAESDTMALFTHPGFRRLLARVSAAPNN